MPETRYYETYNHTTGQKTSVPYEVDDEQIEDDKGPELVRQSVTRVRTIVGQLDTAITTARTIATAGTNPTPAQIKGLFGAFADLAEVVQLEIKILRVLMKGSGHVER